MVLNQALHRALKDMTQNEALCLGCERKQVVILMGHASHEMHWQVRASIGRNVDTEELAEILDDQVFEQWVVQMLADI